MPRCPTPRGSRALAARAADGNGIEQTIPGGPSVACSTAKAIEWDASFQNSLNQVQPRPISPYLDLLSPRSRLSPPYLRASPLGLQDQSGRMVDVHDDATVAPAVKPSRPSKVVEEAAAAVDEATSTWADALANDGPVSPDEAHVAAVEQLENSFPLPASRVVG